MSKLPKVNYKGKTWYFDYKLGQIRNIDNPHDFINLVGRDKDEFYISTPDVWIYHPYLPVVRNITKEFISRNPKFFEDKPAMFGDRELGVMVHNSIAGKLVIKIFKSTLFLLKDSDIKFYTYSTFKDVLDDGWKVD